METAYKVDENTIGIVKIEEVKSDHQYNIDFLLQQLEDIQAQIELRRKEQAEVRELLKHAFILE